MQMTGGLPALFGVQEGVITDSSGLYYEQAAQRLLQMMTCPVPASAPGSHAVAAKLSGGNPRALLCTLGKRRRCSPRGRKASGRGIFLHPSPEGPGGVSLCPGSQQHPGMWLLARWLPAHPGMSVPRFPAHPDVPLPASLLTPACRCSG